MSAAGKYFFDGNDMFIRYGFIPMSGKNDFMRFPDLKEPFSHDWKDQNGTEYDLSNPIFKTRTATLEGHIQANGIADFENKHALLFQDLKTPGTHNITVSDLNQTFQVFYRSNPTTKSKSGAFKKATEIYVYIELTFEIIGGGYIDSGLGNFYFGSVSSFGTSWANVLDLSGFQTEGQSNVINLNTGTSDTKFMFAVRSARSISKVTDLNSSNEDLTSLYTVRGSVNNQDGVPYTIYGMSLAVPYEVNHVHQIQMN